MRLVPPLIALVLALTLAAPWGAAQDDPEPTPEGTDGSPGGENETESEPSPQWSVEAFLKEAHSWGTLKVTVGPDSMTADWTGLQLGEQASQAARYLADGALSGEKDGTVDDREKADFLFALGVLFEREFAKAANHRAFSGIVLIDEAEAQKVEVTGVSADGLAGPVDQQALLAASLGLKVSFPNLDKHKDIHTVRLNLGNYYLRESEDDAAARIVGDLALVIQPADGWTLDPASIQPDCAGANLEDNRVVLTADDAPCFTERAGVLLSFAITGQGERDPNVLPSTGLLAATTALAAGVALRRRL